MNAGKNPYELMREIRLPAGLEVDERYGKVSWGVRGIFEAYGGWFHFDSTAELLADAPSSINAEVAALAGRRRWRRGRSCSTAAMASRRGAGG